MKKFTSLVAVIMFVVLLLLGCNDQNFKGGTQPSTMNSDKISMSAESSGETSSESLFETSVDESIEPKEYMNKSSKNGQ